MRQINSFPSNRDFSSLSIKDLLEARDHYHRHLSHLENVAATAIGRYRIREGDWYEKNPPDSDPPADYQAPTGARTLFNSVITPWSWPCVLVFVREWQADKEIAKERGYDHVVPRQLYLPDGRVVPTCVIEMKQQTRPAGAMPQLGFPKQFIGGGYPVFSEVQGKQHVGSIGCLVTDGNLTYALTNRHVTGDSEREIYSMLAGEEVAIGISDRRQLGKRAFASVYEGWPGRFVYANLDAGLIKLNEVSRWTTQVRSLGELDRPIDLNPDTLTLDLIDCPVRAYGAASGDLYGIIAGFFYRYKSMGGFDYVADLVIAPREMPSGDASNTLPGDSGTLWCLEVTELDRERPSRLRPIALQWGGQVVLENAAEETPHSFTLATALSTICRELDVDLVRGWNDGLPEYWGAVGHYTLAAKACRAIADSRLRMLMLANLSSITYPEPQISASRFKGLSKHPFVPLADVPDYVWKVRRLDKTRRNPAFREAEQPAHFADMDKPVTKAGQWHGRTLLDLCRDEKNIDVAVWQEYYKLVGDRSKGTLPFRVWQIFDEMVDFARKKDMVAFVAAGGILAHYVGDACQPLHLSHMYNGETISRGERRGEGVHEAYEATMLNRHVPQIMDGLDRTLERDSIWDGAIDCGRDAAIQTVALMRRTFELLPPRKILDAYVEQADLWARFQRPTIQTLANGALLLARLWDCAWALGGGASMPDAKLIAIPEEQLARLYRDHDFLPSMKLSEIGSVLRERKPAILTRGKKIALKAAPKPAKKRVRTPAQPRPLR